MDTNILGALYEKSTDIETRKSIGQYYTPDFIIKYILDRTLGDLDIVEKPFISIIDISCGAGYFLTASYDILREKFISNIKVLQERYKESLYEIEKDGDKLIVKGREYWQEENIPYHILKNCIFGADKDEIALDLTKSSLLSKAKIEYSIELNIVQCDSLIRWENKEEDVDPGLKKFWSRQYDISIGNPPYIGHKQLSLDQKAWLLEEYREVFKNKSDISYCFFQRILEILKPEGISAIITSRYFMEGPMGKDLRLYLRNNTNILEIVDFYGGEIFKDVRIATAIYVFKKANIPDNMIKIHKLTDEKYKLTEMENLKEKLESSLFDSFFVEQDNLDKDRWLLIPESHLNIYKKIEEKSKVRLRDIADTYQGIISGCDRAFVLNLEEIDEYKIEKDLLRPWVKNSDIEEYEINHRGKYLIYSNLIEEEKNYPNSIEFIGRYRDRLINRRECQRGLRKWYQLQWGREERIFRQTKIVFPYKARSNRFAIDYKGYFSSADTYILIVKDKFKESLPLEYLLGLLNSNVYEFYFKLFAKQMGNGIYDYYPNAILDLKIIDRDIIGDISKRTNEIMRLARDKDCKTQEKIKKIKEEINVLIAEYFGLDEDEYNIIKTNIP